MPHRPAHRIDMNQGITQQRESEEGLSNPSAVETAASQAPCTQCGSHALCLFEGLGKEDIARLDGLIESRRKLKRQQTLYRAGDPFHALYAVCSGFFKTEILLEDGREQVTGIHMTGDILGMDGIGTGAHACHAVALDSSQVCVIPFDELERFSREVPGLQRNFHKMMSYRLVRDQGLMTLLGTMSAEERMAAFLLTLSQRFTSRGFSPAEFHLRMTREEIGQCLGLKLETVSRTLSRMQEDGLITVQQKHIRILDAKRLKKIFAHPLFPR